MMDKSLYELAFSAGSLRDGKTFEDWFVFMGGESWLSQNSDRGADKELLEKEFRKSRAAQDIFAGELPRVPPVEYRALVDLLGKGGGCEGAEKILDQIIFNSVRLRGYIEGRLRHGDNDKAHALAVKMSNRYLRTVRSTFGYHTTTDLSY